MDALIFVMIMGKRKDVTCMSGFWRRALALACAWAVLLSCASALAEFSPRWTEWSRKEGVSVTLGATAEAWNPLSKASLAQVNEWLTGLSLTLNMGASEQAALSMNGESLLQVGVQRLSGYTLTTFAPSGGAYLTSPDAPDALSLLAGEGVSLPDPAGFPGAYVKLAPGLYEKLASHTAPKAAKQVTSIKNSTASTANEVYTFSGDELNEFWPRVLDTLLPALENALEASPDLYSQAEALLEELTFSGECKFKRFLSKDGEDMGLQFTGQAARGEDKRKVTLFYGFTPNKGGYLSFSLPAVKGKNNLKLTVAVAMTQKNGVNTFSVESAYTCTLDGKTVSATLDGSLKNTVREESEKWTGKVTLTRTENKVKTTWTLFPDWTWTDEGMTGSAAVQQKTGNTVKLKATVNVAVTDYQPFALPSAASAKDLRALTLERARTAVQAELAPLTLALGRLIAPLSEKERDTLLHDLRTDAWMNGPVVPVAEEGK